VRLQTDASVSFGSVLRGDNEWIEIGERSQVQDNATLHTDPGFPLAIGDNCAIGHAWLQHCAEQPDRHGCGAAQWRQDRTQLPGRCRRAGDRAQEISRQLADRRQPGACDPHLDDKSAQMIAAAADVYVRRWESDMRRD
jgi:hypothetical protein